MTFGTRFKLGVIAARTVNGIAGRREVPGGQGAEQRPIHFLREGRVTIAGAQARLDMADWDLVIERAQAPEESTGGVALDERRIDVVGFEKSAEPGGEPAGKVPQGLPRTHHPEVVIAANAESAKYLVNHVAVLRSGQS